MKESGSRNFPLKVLSRIRKLSTLKVILLVSICFLLLTLFILGSYLLIVDFARRNQVFPGTKIEGIDVGGLSREEAVAKIAGELEGPLTQPLQLYYSDKTVHLEASSFDLKVDVEGMVDRAISVGRGQPFLNRMFNRLFNKPLNTNIPLKLEYDEKKLETALETIAQGFDQAPVNASIDMSDGVPELLSSSNGRKVLRPESLKNIKAALPGPERKVPLVVTAVAPELTEEDIGYIVVIRLSQHILEVYYQEGLVISYPVAVGSEEYPTPTGKYYIVHKEKNPTWIPPPSDWAKGKEPIPPGPDNPLGSYWMELSMRSVGIHATNSDESIGYSVSHGCIRLLEWSAADLYERVEVGTPVYILE